MTRPNDADKLKGLLRDYLRGSIGRRQFLILGAQAGLSVSALGWLTRPASAANLMDSDPVLPFESPITPERVAFLKTKP
jgi:hypothetical protein